jgi:8-oxo-dGTP pyrophosphatase MutT (NUDIX family)
VVRRLPQDGAVLVALSRLGAGGDCFLPKGGVEKGETLEQAARREIAEEAGLTDLTLLAPLGTRSRLNWNRKRWITTHYFLFCTDQEEGRPTDPRQEYQPSGRRSTTCPRSSGRSSASSSRGREGRCCAF